MVRFSEHSQLEIRCFGVRFLTFLGVLARGQVTERSVGALLP